jgi:amino acid transporter
LGDVLDHALRHHRRDRRDLRQVRGLFHAPGERTLQTLFTAGKLLAIGLIIVVGFTLGSRVPEHFVPAQELTAGVSVGGFLTALVAGLFAFGGWHMVTYSSEETVNPKRTIPCWERSSSPRATWP